MQNNEEKKIWYREYPLLSWLVDIEIDKAPYLISLFSMVLSVVLVLFPFAKISAPFIEESAYTLFEVEELAWVGIVLVILNIVSIGSILIPIGWFYEWKCKWFVPPIITALYDAAIVLFIDMKKNELLENTLIGYVYDYLSIDLELTASAWLLLVIAVIALVCSIKMIIDVKNNKRFYQL